MISTTDLDLSPVCEREVLRYMGIRGNATDAERALISAAAADVLPALTPRACYAVLDVATVGDVVNIGGRTVRSRSLARLLCGATRAVIFAVTVGPSPDRAVRKFERLSPATALAADALGSERVEAACDALCATLCRDFGALGYKLTPRFSPGYGDLPLDFQRDVFDLLSPDRRIGVTLGAGLLMTPTKSVTAILGLLPATPANG